MPNLSQQKRERMMAFLHRIKDEHKDDDEMLIALGEIENELASKKYGLVWERHEEAVDVMMQDNIPVFTEVPEREIAAAPEQGYNFILEGDNLHSLRLLEKTHKGKIDLIYIDPPYNTGNKDFIYDDAFVDKTDLFSHSKWLSFMDERLRLARNLLSEKGVIFISIDDNEESPLKMLCDDIFGTDRFVANIAWQRNYSARNDSKGIVREVEHLLVYSHSDDWSPKKLPRTAEMDAKYKILTTMLQCGAQVMLLLRVQRRTKAWCMRFSIHSQAKCCIPVKELVGGISKKLCWKLCVVGATMNSRISTMQKKERPFVVLLKMMYVVG